jgi:hypothetical protein
METTIKTPTTKEHNNGPTITNSPISSPKHKKGEYED